MNNREELMVQEQFDDLLSRSRILVIAPHPDDETYGCGGLIARARAHGGQVYVMIVSAGDLQHYDEQLSTVTASRRQKELEESMRVLGVEDYCILFTDRHSHMRMDSVPRRDLLEEIERASPLAMDRLHPDMVILPAISYNQDHEAVFKAGFTACRPGMPTVRPVVKVVLSDAPQLGWNWEPFHPNVYVDISDYLEIKLKAHACHVSQARPALTMAAWRTWSAGPPSVAPRSRSKPPKRSTATAGSSELRISDCGMAGSEGQDGETRPGAAHVAFALRIIRFVTSLPRNKVTDVVGYQLLKSGTSIGANYREANSAESRDDFIHRTAIVEKEAAETEYWLEVCAGAEIGEAQERHALRQESGELLAIFTSIGRTTRARWSTR